MPQRTFVATLIVSPRRADLSDALIARAAQALGAVEATQWLDRGVAADLVFSSQESGEAAHRVREALAGESIDCIVQPMEGRRKRLLIADMDSTMIGQECIDELADHAGVRAHVSAITERAMRGEIAFEPALRERVALLKGLPLSIIDTVLDQRITLTPGARALVRTMRAAGAFTALVSGGFTRFTEVIAARLGFHENRANLLLTDGDRFSGEVAEPILGRDAKKAALDEISARLALRPHETLAVGDGANDLTMLGAAGLGVAYHAKPAVAAAAHARIDHGDLTALLYAQGYRREEFIET
jgi:phosphoserine phosphatase